MKDGASLARDLKAEVHVLSILNTAAWAQAADITSALPVDIVAESARSLLEEGLNKLSARGIRATGHFALGDPLNQIPFFANDLKADFIVIGHCQTSRLARWWAGRNDGLSLD